ncbi:hypothetical protein [Lacticaseibacillus parakribbianus]|uniref:hypothetical protein n=1 Tax=Lacticaseibacillus parakribbianus TaxID=2970927 RepID=UPI0021CB6070|nr:hypothetical protein [Lacticaseibacillus parakribbianus]
MRNSFKVVLLATLVEGVLAESKTVQVAETDNQVSYQTVTLPKNAAKFSPQMSATQTYHEIARQYQYAYPNYEGPITAYAVSQYKKML